MPASIVTNMEDYRAAYAAISPARSSPAETPHDGNSSSDATGKIAGQEARSSRTRDSRDPSLSPADRALKAWEERFLPPDQATPDGLRRIEEDRKLKRLGLEPCQTCANRKYQDASGDGSVSFKAPTHVAPEAAAGAVSAHEQEHVHNERAYAQQEGREVVSQSVQIFTSVCPECGKVYVSGGVTRTTTVSRPQKTEDVQELDLVA